MHLTASQVNQLKSRAVSLQSRLKRMVENGNAATQQVLGIAEVGVTAFALGVAETRFNGGEVLGMPASMWTLLLGHGLGFAGIAPEHMHNVGNAGLAVYSHTLGAGVGAKMAAAHG